jgi:hypothetical protein
MQVISSARLVVFLRFAPEEPGGTRSYGKAVLINLVTAAERQGMSSCAKDGIGPPCVMRWRRVTWVCSHLASFPRRPSAPRNSEPARRIRNGKNRRIKLRFSLRTSIRFQGLNFIPQACPAEARRCTAGLPRAANSRLGANRASQLPRFSGSGSRRLQDFSTVEVRTFE